MSNNGNFGGLTLIKKGRAHPVWRARVVVDGQRHTRNFTLRVDAEAWLESLRHQFTTNTFDAARAAERLTLRAAAERYRTEQVAMGASIEQMKKLNAVTRHAGVLLDMPLASIMPSHIRDYRDQRMGMKPTLKHRRGVAPPSTTRHLNSKTVNKEISAISIVFRYARVEWGMGTLTNPTTDVRLQEEDADIGKRIQPEAIDRLLQEARRYEEHDDCTTQITAYIECAVLTTARLSALSKAKWSDFSPTGKTLEVPIRNSKNGKRYSVILTARAREILAALPRTNEFIFGGNPSSVATAWNRVKRRANIDVRLHDLRHEGISRLFENAHTLGLSDFDISLATSHRSPAAMKRYVHLKSASVVDKIDRNTKSEMQRFVEDLLVDGDSESITLAVALARKKKQFEERENQTPRPVIDLPIERRAIATASGSVEC
eukprot:TRINITY_DN11353_c0_g1_i14.p1 TRINITY_DN11353_c0_g1~~TRINITY_DN11353_c0_g1_i14.p1  ORF type:complete len:431 (-),score=75.48 TRINITY_DN11353_c0_g1_i14:304-1596(-)